jgi:hypothetical protein
MVWRNTGREPIAKAYVAFKANAQWMVRLQIVGGVTFIQAKWLIFGKKPDPPAPAEKDSNAPEPQDGNQKTSDEVRTFRL